MQEFIVPFPQHLKKYSFIPAKAGIQRRKTLSRATRHIIPAQDYLNVIPAYAGIHIPAYAGIHSPIPPTPEKILCHSREGRNPKGKNTIQSDQTHHSRAGLPQRHSREGGNPQFPRMREFIVPFPQHLKKYSFIPAKAGIQREKTLSRATRHIIPAQDYLNVIPAKAGIHNSRKKHYPERPDTSFPRRTTSTSREGGNPKEKNTIQSNQTHPIPAYAGIHT